MGYNCQSSTPNLQWANQVLISKKLAYKVEVGDEAHDVKTAEPQVVVVFWPTYGSQEPPTTVPRFRIFQEYSTIRY